MKKAVLFSFFLLGFTFLGYAQNPNPNIKVDPEIPELVQLKVHMTIEGEIGDRYKIQLGSYSSKDKAEEVVGQFKDKYDTRPAKVKYESPNYKVWIGDFTSRLKAERVYLKVKDTFKSALIFRPHS